MKKLVLLCALTVFSIDAYGARAKAYQPQDLVKKNQCATWGKKFQERRLAGKVKNNLTIGFEGFMSYSSYSVKCLNQYQQGLRSKPPAGRGRGFLTKQFMGKLEKGSSEFLILPNTHYTRRGSSAKRSKFINCIKTFKKYNPGVEINLAGHSFGGASAKVLEEDMERNGVEVNHTTTFDPRDWSKWSNITYNCYASTCRNYRQRRPLAGADMNEDGTRAIDLDVTSAGLGHGRIPSYPPALAHFKGVLR